MDSNKTYTTYMRDSPEEDVRDAPIARVRIDNALNMARKGGDDECVSDRAWSGQRVGATG